MGLQVIHDAGLNAEITSLFPHGIQYLFNEQSSALFALGTVGVHTAEEFPCILSDKRYWNRSMCLGHNTLKYCKVIVEITPRVPFGVTPV